jgi:hypothetical protein
MGAQRKQFLWGIVLVALVTAGAMLLPLQVGVWVPDMIAAPRKVLAEARRENGESVRVIQYWNRCDFYSTELWYVGTNGVSRTCTLDGDDSKSWNVPLSVDWETKKARVTLGGGRLRVVDLARGEWAQ